ncbi:MAG: polysaccharide deacetylase family protein [Desulfitobacterium hafniense]|nr:polysaccharide deacetylase family protein [Desulfitobacterium hafniense]
MYVIRIPRTALVTTVLFCMIALGFRLEQRMVLSVSSIPQPIEHVKTNQKVMALTINVDWGEEYIPAILNILDQGKAKATFFVTGRWAKKYPELIKLMVSRGHEVENHGYSHPHPDNLSIAANKEEISRTETILFELSRLKTRFYAPPYGERGLSGLKAANELGYKTILWTLDTVDWRPESSAEIIANRVLNPQSRFGIKPDKHGAIVLMHPKPNTVKALPVILKQLDIDGFKLVTINELITFGIEGNTTS